MLSTPYRHADTIKRIQLALQLQLRELEQSVAPPFTDNMYVVRTRIKAVLALTIEQFRTEEHDGYMKSVREQDQRFESEIQGFRDEHRELKRELDFLVDEADALQEVDNAFADEVNAWIARYRDHEKSEVGLVQEAFAADVGGEGG